MSQLAAPHSATQRHTAPHGATRRHTAPHSATRRHMAPHGATRRHTAPHSATWRHMAPHGAPWRHTAPYSATQRLTAPHGATRRHTAPHGAPRRHTAPYSATRRPQNAVLLSVMPPSVTVAYEEQQKRHPGLASDRPYMTPRQHPTRRQLSPRHTRTVSVITILPADVLYTLPACQACSIKHHRNFSWNHPDSPQLMPGSSYN